MWFHHWWYNDTSSNTVLCTNLDNNNDYDYADKDENCHKYPHVKVFLAYILGNKQEKNYHNMTYTVDSLFYANT